jgi:hypothetical protein
MLVNYRFKYQARGKFIFVPNELCVRRGERLLHFFSKTEFPEYFFHYRAGGHISALHQHLPGNFFFKIDIQNFFYSIARERVFRALREWNFRPGGNYARWSCVRNPYANGPRYVLPIGFIQSTLLASLALMRSPVDAAIQRAKQKGVFVSVYLDDFIGSHQHEEVLRATYEDILQSLEEARLTVNANKLTPPSAAIVAFNCDLSHGTVAVAHERIARFIAEARGPASQQAFDMYRRRVASQNADPS